VPQQPGYYEDFYTRGGTGGVVDCSFPDV